MDAYDIAKEEEREALKGAASQLHQDYDIEPDFEEIDVMKESEGVVEVGSD